MEDPEVQSPCHEGPRRENPWFRKECRLKEYAEYGENLVGVTVHSKSKDEDAIWGGKMALFKVLRASSGHHVNTTSARKEHPKTLNSKRDETRRTH